MPLRALDLRLSALCYCYTLSDYFFYLAANDLRGVDEKSSETADPLALYLTLKSAGYRLVNVAIQVETPKDILHILPVETLETIVHRQKRSLHSDEIFGSRSRSCARLLYLGVYHNRQGLSTIKLGVGAVERLCELKFLGVSSAWYLYGTSANERLFRVQWVDCVALLVAYYRVNRSVVEMSYRGPIHPDVTTVSIHTECVPGQDVSQLNVHDSLCYLSFM